MLEPQEWRGEWWIAAEPETVRPGVLRRDEEDRFRLELVGGFDIRLRKPHPGGGEAVMAETREVEMIHGIAEGARYTLLFPHAIHTSSGQRTENIVKQDWSSNRVLCGIHLASPDEAVFTTAHLRLDYLLHWSDRTTLTLTIPMQDGKMAGPLEVRRLADSVAVAAHYEQMRLELRVRSHEFNIERRPAAGTTTVQTTEWAVLDFDPPQPVPYDAFDTVYKDLQDLLTRRTRRLRLRGSRNCRRSSTMHSRTNPTTFARSYETACTTRRTIATGCSNSPPSPKRRWSTNS